MRINATKEKFSRHHWRVLADVLAEYKSKGDSAAKCLDEALIEALRQDNLEFDEAKFRRAIDSKMFQ